MGVKMKGFTCKKCNTELEYEQLQGIRLKYQRDDGTYYFNAYCPACKEYKESDE